MTMFHHDARSYETAANEAREYLRKSVQRDAARAARGLQSLQNRVIRDQLLPISDATYALDGSTIRVNGQRLTPQAFGQLCQKAELRVDFAKKLLTSDNPLRRNLALENFETLSATADGSIMLRSVDDVIHGVVSDSYKRIDSGLIVGAFSDSFQANKLMPVQCELSNTRVYMRALMPRIYGEEFGEALCFGIELRTSDFGFGLAEITPFCNRVWCTNKARMSFNLGKGFKKTHRGARVTSETFELSAETQELQMRALASEMKDAVSGFLSDRAINTYVGAIGRCFAEGQRGGWNVEKQLERLLEQNKLTEKQAKYVSEVHASTDRDVVPQIADNRWKLAQAIAYAAQHMDIEDIDTRFELEYLAGEIVDAAPANALLAVAN